VTLEEKSWDKLEFAVQLLEKAGRIHTVNVSVDDTSRNGKYIVSMIPETTGTTIPETCQIEFTGTPVKKYT